MLPGQSVSLLQPSVKTKIKRRRTQGGAGLREAAVGPQCTADVIVSEISFRNCTMTSAGIAQGDTLHNGAHDRKKAPYATLLTLLPTMCGTSEAKAAPLEEVAVLTHAVFLS